MKLRTYLKKDLELICRLFKKHIVILSLILISYLATYGLNLFLANLLKPRLYGDISIVFQILLFSLPFALLGTELSMMHYLPKYLEEKDYGLASGFLRWNLKTFFITALCIFGLGLIALVITSIVGNYMGASSEDFHIVLFSFWLIPLFALIILQSTLLQTLKRYFLAASFRGFAVSFMIFLTIMLFLSTFENTWVGGYRRPFSILMCVGIAYLIIIGFQFYLIYQKLPREIYHAKPHYQKKRWLYHSTEMLGSFVGYTALAAIQIVLLEIMSHDEVIVGHFASIIVIGSSIMVFALAVDLFMNPHISSLVEKNKTHLQSMLDIVNIFKLIPAALIGLIVVIFGETLLEHFGKSFVGAYPALIILLFGYLVGLALSSTMPLLVYSGHHMLNFKISIIQIVAIVALSLIFIPLFGIEGAALALSLTILIAGTLRLYFVRKFLGINCLFVI